MDKEEIIFSAKAVLTSYLVLAGIYFLMAFFYLFISINDKSLNYLGASIICFFTGFGFSIWLNGFQIQIFISYVIFRDGFYKETKIALDQIHEIKHCWIDVMYLYRVIKMPRMMIKYGNKKSFAINSKPFSREAIRTLRCYVQQPPNRTE